jgi:hypothetical protein
MANLQDVYYLTEMESDCFDAWWLSLTPCDQEKVMGEIVRPQGYACARDWFAGLPKTDQSYVPQLYSHEFICEEEAEEACESCSQRARCMYVA